MDYTWKRTNSEAMTAKEKKNAPTVEIITIGDEILIGQVVDTNSAWMAKELNKKGFQVIHIATVSDEERSILNVIDQAFSRSDVVLMTGGLGPTKDDITKQTLCTYFNTKLVYSTKVEQDIRELFSTRPHILNELTLNQAYVPETATVLTNRCGTAPVTWFEHQGKILVSMPGVPSEMESAMSNDVLPRLTTYFQTPTLIHKTIVVVGIPESTLAMKIAEWENQLPTCLHLAYLPAASIVRLRMSGTLEDRSKLETILEEETFKLRNILGKSIFAEEDITPEVVIGNLLKEKGLWLATAESCTGGNIAHLLTTVSGSSDYFLGSIVAYKNEVKIEQLGVTMESLSNFGAVSQEVVEEMAKGVRNRLHADIGLAVTGIAGPNGATEGKPVGTVWIGVSNNKLTLSRRFQFGQIRKRNIENATLMALALLKELLEE
jgi:nicotinamide-nucleotide amidase